MFKKILKLAFLAIIIPVFFTGIANAQVIEREGIEEIIVTAQKTEQNIQDVPIAVTAFDTGSLELQQIETFGDIQFNAPNITFTSDLFIPLHIICVRINPDAPTNAPLIIKALFINTNPVAAAATPEYEFSNDITTGISAPPIGMVKVIPIIAANAKIP